MENIENIQNTIKSGKSTTLMTSDELNYINNSPIGKAMARKVGRPRKVLTEDELAKKLKKNPIGRPKLEKKSSPNDKILCEICGKYYTRSGSCNHKRTQYHQLHLKMDKKIRDVLIGNSI